MAITKERPILDPVESGWNKFDQEELAKQEVGFRQADFTLDDFKKQLGQIGNLGPIRKIVSIIPGMGGMTKMLHDQHPEEDIRRLVGIIDAMTPDERRSPSKTVDRGPHRRIAAGAGVEPHMVNDLVNQFDGMAGMMKKMASMGFMERMKAIHQLGSGGMLNLDAKFAKHAKRSGKRLTAEERARLRKLRADEDAESSQYEPRLRRFGILCLLVFALLPIVWNLVAWGMGANATAGFLAFVCFMALVVVILTRRRMKRADSRILPQSPDGLLFGDNQGQHRACDRQARGNRTSLAPSRLVCQPAQQRRPLVQPTLATDNWGGSADRLWVSLR